MSESSAVTVSRTVDAPPERVWEIGGDPFGIGTRWRETRVMMRREETEEMTVTAVEPGRNYSVEADNCAVHYTSVLRFELAGSHRTTVSVTFMGEPTEPQNVIQRLLGRLGSRVVRKSLGRDLVDLATAAEGEPMNPT